MRIFISHSSEDKYIIDLFVQHILRLGIGLNPDEIFCTSLPGHKIQSGEKFPERIASQLIAADLVLIMISGNYKRSEICLNEMGATWILDKRRYTFILDNLGYDQVGFLLINDQIEKISSEGDLDNFGDTIQDLLEEGRNNVSIWNTNKTKFLLGLAGIKSKDVKEPKEKDKAEPVTEHEMQVLKAIDNSTTQKLSQIGLFTLLRKKEAFVKVVLMDLRDKDLLDFDGHLYFLTDKANRMIYGIE